MPSRPIREVIADVAPRLMAREGIVGVGESALEDGSPCISVLVARKTRDLEDSVPRELEGYPVVFLETGIIRPVDSEDSA